VVFEAGKETWCHLLLKLLIGARCRRPVVGELMARGEREATLSSYFTVS